MEARKEKHRRWNEYLQTVILIIIAILLLL